MKPLVKVVVILALMTLPFRVIQAKSLAERQIEPGGSPPVTTHSFVPEEFSHGDILKIYLEANDSDGDMQKIVLIFDQLGSGHISKSVVVSKGDRASLLGYIDGFINRPAFGVPEWTEVTLTVNIRDEVGHISNRAVFPVTISTGAKQGPPPPPFDTVGLKRLGVIRVKLFFRPE